MFENMPKILTKESLIASTPKLLIELFTVFVGVYLAFIISDYQTEQQIEKKRQQLYSVLSKEVNYFVLGGTFISEKMDSLLNSAGENYTYYLESRAPTPPDAMWKASVESGVLDIIDVNLFYDLSVFYNRLNALSDRYLDYYKFIQENVIGQSRITNFVWDSESGHLKNTYYRHKQDLVAIRDELKRLIGEGQQLLKQIEVHSSI
ncbi:MAG: hypothetical protein KDD94_08260 [Calditrichaeota bacterium]|nr:hypothetical protein [Calditrichota bacterium]